MDKLKLKRYNEIILCVLIAILGVAFIFSAYHLYLSGGTVPYTRERVGEYLLWLLPLSILSIASAILSGVLHTLTYEKESPGAFTSPRVLYERRISRVDLSAVSPDGNEKINKEKNKRRAFFILTLGATAIYLTIALIFALDAGRYSIEGCSVKILSNTSAVS